MKNQYWNMWSISVLVVLLSLACFCAARLDRSKMSELRCYTCAEDSCEGFDFKREEPKNCTADDLNQENLGTNLLWNLTHIPFSPTHQPLPEFVCQKVEAYSIRVVRKVVVRRCALRLAGNETCNYFFNNRERYAKEIYTNATCELCDTDSCNSGTLNYIWIPILFTSIIPCLSMKWI